MFADRTPRRPDRGCSRWATGRPSRSPTGMVIPFASRSCGPVDTSRSASHPRATGMRRRTGSGIRASTPTCESLRDRVIRLAINVPSHSESTARLHNVRSLLLCAGTACVVKAPDSKQLRPLRHNKSSISPQMIELKLLADNGAAEWPGAGRECRGVDAHFDGRWPRHGAGRPAVATVRMGAGVPPRGRLRGLGRPARGPVGRGIGHPWSWLGKPPTCTNTIIAGPRSDGGFHSVRTLLSDVSLDLVIP
jgi:hypothetical protein